MCEASFKRVTVNNPFKPEEFESVRVKDFSNTIKLFVHN